MIAQCSMSLAMWAFFLGASAFSVALSVGAEAIITRIRRKATK